MSQCVAVCRSVSQCVAVCRSVLQCVAVHNLQSHEERKRRRDGQGRIQKSKEYTRRLRENEGVWQTWQDGGESHTRKGRGRTMGRERYVRREG